MSGRSVTGVLVLLGSFGVLWGWASFGFMADFMRAVIG